jgi:hypothetical protein
MLVIYYYDSGLNPEWQSAIILCHSELVSESLKSFLPYILIIPNALPIHLK